MNVHNASWGGDPQDDRFSHRAFHLQSPLDEAQKKLIQIYLRQAMIRREMPMRKFLQHLEKQLIVLALILCSGRLHAASEMLHVKKTTLHEKIKKYRIYGDKKFGLAQSLEAGNCTGYAMDRESSDESI